MFLYSFGKVFAARRSVRVRDLGDLVGWDRAHPTSRPGAPSSSSDLPLQSECRSGTVAGSGGQSDNVRSVPPF